MATAMVQQLCPRAMPRRVGGTRRALRVKASYGAGDEGEPMHVPEDIFKGEDGQNLTPERKAAVALGNLFTMAATRVILDQFTGTRHRSPVYYKMCRDTPRNGPSPLVDFLSANPLRNGNEWLAKLMREPDNDLRITAMRIIETRRVFAETEFNWEVLENVARDETCEDTLEMTKTFLSQSLNVGAENNVSAGGAESNGTTGW